MKKNVFLSFVLCVATFNCSDIFGSDTTTNGDSVILGRGIKHERYTVIEHPTDDWLFWDNYETNKISSYFEGTWNDRFYISKESGLGMSSGIRSDFQKGEIGTGGLKIAFGATPEKYFRPVAAYDEYLNEIYARYYVRYDSDWEGGGGDKMSRFTMMQKNWSQAMICHTWSMGKNYLGIDPATGVNVNKSITGSGSVLKSTKYNDFNNLVWLGSQRSKTPIFDSEHVGYWYCIETHAKLNTPGKNDGAFELWVNDVLECAAYNVNWVGSYEIGAGKGYGINVFMLENYWNDGAFKEQSRYFDNLVISRSKIGMAKIVR
jgi:hypothetical protein